MADCRVCGRKLTNDEIAVTRKLVGMCETSFFCRGCLAERFGVGVETIDMKIKQFRRNGCWLFADDGAEGDREGKGTQG